MSGIIITKYNLHISATFLGCLSEQFWGDGCGSDLHHYNSGCVQCLCSYCKRNHKMAHLESTGNRYCKFISGFLWIFVDNYLCNSLVYALHKLLWYYMDHPVEVKIYKSAILIVKQVKQLPC